MPATPDAALDPPIHVDWVDRRLLDDGRPGGLGVTILPGKHGASVRYPGLVYRRDAADDLARLRQLGVGFMALLVEDAELVRWGDPALAEHAVATGIMVRRFPIPDGAAPPGLEAVDGLLDEIAEARLTSHAVVACMGGVGRSGTIAACAMVAAGATPDEAIAHLRAVRHPEAIETSAQQAFVRAYAAHRARTP